MVWYHQSNPVRVEINNSIEHRSIPLFLYQSIKLKRIRKLPSPTVDHPQLDEISLLVHAKFRNLKILEVSAPRNCFGFRKPGR